jgi:hypothetical protein
MKTKIILIMLMIMLASCKINEKIFIPIDNESKVPTFTLPDPLVFENGDTVKNPGDWRERRAETFELFERNVYGIAPEWEGSISAVTMYENPDAYNGMAIAKEILLTLHYEDRALDVFVLIHLPKSELPVPVFLGYNFFGNHSTTDDPNVHITNSWVFNNVDFGITANKATEESRGLRIHRWPAEEIIKRGYGLITVFYGDIDPDYDDDFKNGVHGLLDERQKRRSWGSIGAWAWGLSRVMDHLETMQEVDAKKVAVMGHSRLGKAALWAGASDERFAIVISNNSGCGGAALSRRKFGETVHRINKRFPHWFAERFNRYNNKEHLLPVDQHQLLALIAPRPLYVASAESDNWADQRGEFLACVEATPVYELFGLDGLPTREMPPVDQPVHGTIGYHIRTGGHDINLYDWKQYMNFADKHFSKNTLIINE